MEILCLVKKLTLKGITFPNFGKDNSKKNFRLVFHIGYTGHERRRGRVGSDNADPTDTGNGATKIRTRFWHRREKATQVHA
jgi:hypothetical protein